MEESDGEDETWFPSEEKESGVDYSTLALALGLDGFQPLVWRNGFGHWEIGVGRFLHLLGLIFFIPFFLTFVRINGFS